jgi:ectonucleotide pyrophosphatase/phosphodiesterase family protein 5
MRPVRPLLAVAALAGLVALPPVQAQEAGAEKTRVYVVTIDGLNLEEVPLMPFVSSLAAEGTYYTEGRAVMVAETIPNHVAMVTGVYPDRNGIVANDYPDTSVDEAVGMGDPALLQADSLFTLIERQCPELATAAVTSKDYLYHVMNHDRTGDGKVDADYNFANEDDPTFIPPPAGLTPDERTIAEALRVVREQDPSFLFVNLGAVDRVGHADVAGSATTALPTGTRPAIRDVQRTNTDNYLRAFVESLKQAGTWDSTALLIAADHSMDWSLPQQYVSLTPAFEADPLLAGEVVVAQNGGAGLYSLADRDAPEADERLARMREIAVATEGVDEALYREPNSADGGRQHWVGAVHPDWHQTHPRSGDLLVTVQDGWRVTEPEPYSNPIPGNHGMPSTLRIPTIVSGGVDVVQARVEGDPNPFVRAPDQAENVDLGPTAAWLLGVRPPARGFDGRVLDEAFAARPAAASCVAAAAAPTAVPTPGPMDRPASGSGSPARTLGSRLAATGAASALPVAGVALLAGALLFRRGMRGGSRRAM